MKFFIFYLCGCALLFMGYMLDNERTSDYWWKGRKEDQEYNHQWFFYIYYSLMSWFGLFATIDMTFSGLFYKKKGIILLIIVLLIIITLLIT